MRRRTSIVALTTACSIAVAVVIGEAHDLFLKPRDFVVRPGAEVQVRVLNGGFTSSEASVARNRLRDLTVAGPNGIAHPDRASWADSAKESHWRVTLREPGTHVLGASLDPRTIRLGGTDFNKYLRDAGLPDILTARKAARQLGDSAHERYAKHVKALVRVQPSGATGAKGASAATAYRIVLGYPAELIPLDDPYVLPSGGTLRVRAIADGRPLVGQVVQAGGRTTSGARIPQREVTTDSAGVARFRLATRGTWYVKFIHMRQVPRSERDSVTHESKWATLTFARP